MTLTGQKVISAGRNGALTGQKCHQLACMLATKHEMTGKVYKTDIFSLPDFPEVVNRLQRLDDIFAAHKHLADRDLSPHQAATLSPINKIIYWQSI